MKSRVTAAAEMVAVIIALVLTGCASGTTVPDVSAPGGGAEENLPPEPEPKTEPPDEPQNQTEEPPSEPESPTPDTEETEPPASQEKPETEELPSVPQPPSAAPQQFRAQQLPYTDEEFYSDYFTALTITDQYWTTHFSEFIAGPYNPIPVYSGNPQLGLGLYDAPAEVVSCGLEPYYAAYDQNAHYCPGPPDFLAFDIDFMLKARTLGDAFVYFIAAHEWAHSIQFRVAQENRDVALELQADCLAGATLRGMVNDGTLLWEQGDDQEVEASLIDIAGTGPWGETSTHGSAEQRIAEYSRGVTNGVLNCLTYGANVG